MDVAMFKQALVKATENKIKAELGSLRDLPEELVNTMANIYYRYCWLFMRIDGPDQGSLLEKIAKSENLARTYRTTMQQAADIVLAYENGIKLIEKLREAVPKKKSEYKLQIDLILDRLKYGMENPEHKTMLGRKVYRKFHKPDEVNNLFTLMNL